MTGDYTVLIPSNRQSLVEETQKSLFPIQSHHVDGSGTPSFSNLINRCIASCPTEICIIVCDKVRASVSDIERMLSLLNDGYGLVGLYRYGFFGLKKDVIRKVGFFDERFITGGAEDNDMTIRMKENNVAVYLSEDAKYIPMSSTWIWDVGLRHFIKKWGTQSGEKPSIIRKMGEETYSYDLGPNQESQFLTDSNSVIGPSSIDWFPGNIFNWYSAEFGQKFTFTKEMYMSCQVVSKIV